MVRILFPPAEYPYLDPETPILEAVVQRAKTDGVDLVMLAGEVVYEAGRFTRVDRDAALRELHESLQHALACQRRCCPMSAVSTPSTSTPKPTCPITVRVRGCGTSNHVRRIPAPDTSPDSPRLPDPLLDSSMGCEYLKVRECILR